MVRRGRSQPVPDADEFPPRQIDSIRVDSQGEEIAYIAAWPAPAGGWQVEGTGFIPGIPSTQKRVLLRAPDGAQTVIHFLVGTYHEVAQRTADPAAARVERAMREISSEASTLKSGMWVRSASMLIG